MNVSKKGFKVFGAVKRRLQKAFSKSKRILNWLGIMPDGHSIQRILALAKEKEKVYEWLVAADFYEQAFRAIEKENLLTKGEAQEKIGYCFLQAAFQADTRADFKNRIVTAVKTYEKAVRLLENTEGLDRQAKINHCKAMILYTNSWLSANLFAKKKQLDECWRLEKEALRFYEKADDQLSVAETCNRLMTFLINRLEIEWEAEWREKIVEETLECGEKAIKIFSKIPDRSQLAQAYALTAFFYRNATFARDFNAERREESRKKALNYPQKAMEISEEIGDVYLIALSNLYQANSRLDITGSTGLQERQYYEKALKCSVLTKDNLLIADSLFGLEFATKSSAEAQEDPDKAREEYGKLDEYREEAIAHYKIIGHNAGIATACCFGIDIPIEQRLALETDLRSKHLLIGEYVKVGYKCLEHANLSGSMGVTFHAMRVLARTLVHMARVETDTHRKREFLGASSKYIEKSISILEKASALSLAEPREFNLSFCIWSLALNQAELANTEEASDAKIKMLKNAITSMRRAREYWLQWVKSPWTHVEKWTAHSEQWTGMGITEMVIGKTFNRLHALTHDDIFLRDAVEAFEGSIESYSEADSAFSRLAEGYWELAKTHDKMGNCKESAKNFQSASNSYIRAAEKIPQLKDFYKDYALYMEAWSEIEKARQFHSKKEYGLAKEYYERAASLHKSTKRWTYLTSNYLAWTRLEEAEDLSRKEQTKEAKDGFQKAAKLFAEAKKIIQNTLEKIEDAGEKETLLNLVKASDIRLEYCSGRISLEEAKMLHRQGDLATSSERYASAAEIFQKTIDTMEHESERQELRPIVYLCRAWQTLTRAEAEASPELYLNASQLFEEVKEHSLDDRAKLLVLGHSRFCKALAAGTKFEDTREATMYSTAKKHLEGAENYYLKAGFKSTSEYVKATRILFDAYMYVHKAETEVDPTKKTQYYRAAERLLKVSTVSYMKAKYIGKSKEVESLLKNVKDKRQLAMSLIEVLHGTTIASTTTSFSTPNPTHEQAVGLERFEHAIIEAHLSVAQEVTVEQEFEIRLDLVNVAQNLGILVRVEDLIPRGFKVRVLPSYYSVENSSLNMRGKRLAPLEVESIRLFLKAREAGVVNLNPKVIFIDEVGQIRTCSPKPITISVTPRLTFEFKTKVAPKIFDFLISAFVEDYMRRKMPLERSGWRSLMQIVTLAKVPKSRVYGAARSRGRAISELERRGLVETRFFTGERGRGGRILKTRIFYDRETIKRYIDERVMKIKKN